MVVSHCGMSTRVARNGNEIDFGAVRGNLRHHCGVGLMVAYHVVEVASDGLVLFAIAGILPDEYEFDGFAGVGIDDRGVGVK